MGFWTRGPDRPSETNGSGAPGGAPAGASPRSVGGNDLLRAVVVLWDAGEAQARLVDGALAGATEAAQSLGQTAAQAESIATSGEELASSANELAASIEQMTASAANLAVSVAQTGASVEETSRSIASVASTAE